MLSKLELFAEACAKLDKRGIVMQEKRCLRKRHIHSSCQRCSDICPTGAITCTESLVFLGEKCSGCGACATVCPSGALAAKLPSNREISALVFHHVKHSGAVAFACETYLKVHPAERRRVISVQCIARCDEAILVAAVLSGATHVAILNTACEDCVQNKVCAQVQVVVDTANRLLACWKYPQLITITPTIPQKIKPLPVAEGEVTGMSRRNFLTAFKRKSESLVTQVLPEIILTTEETSAKNNNEIENPLEEPKHLPDKWRALFDSLQRLPSTAVSEFPSTIWGDIRIDSSCNGCGTCADACPSSALTIHKQQELWRLSVDVSHCTQCGLCKDVCCRGSIEVISTVALNEILDQKSQVLVEKRQEEIDTLLEPIEDRMARLLGCSVKN
ncbi:MAG: 4Fe-4S ferredoxin iron-sulfur binding domain protein [Firmicutes bacterium]|nr:4Fe-4S ferredoxin iron-sulfur binding domain protein [Bacillota bacterium]